MQDAMLAARRALVDRMADRRIADARVLDAMRRVPRERFVDRSLRAAAYLDEPLPIGRGQTISQPTVVAMMVAAADLTPRSRALEVGAGCGYAAAVIALLAAEAFAIERDLELAEAAGRRLAALGYRNVAIRHGDGAEGWPDKAPFDAILVSAAAKETPPRLLEQLAVGGRLVVPLGSPNRGQRLTRLVKAADGRFREEPLGYVRFVPLVRDGD